MSEANTPLAGEDEASVMRGALGKAIANLPKPVRFRAENAFHGFEKAVALLAVDREMASFRAITAEEEAAAALFRSLQLRRYPGANGLNLGNHRHKAAVGPFIWAVRSTLGGKGFVKQAQMTLDYAAPSLQLHLPLHELGVVFPGSEDMRLTFTEPLGLTRRKGPDEALDRFGKELAELASAQSFANIHALIAKEANARNRLLYASDAAPPITRVTPAAILARRDRADICLFLCIAIMQTRAHQAFALQALDAFLEMVGKMPDQPIHHAPAPQRGIQFIVHGDRPTTVQEFGSILSADDE
ncbi:hypothetical protein [Brevundimonas sp.]|uniref:hypothetical protein n=1 Tax=Brevundimonas sp. TaxID=1871086 RepID=UPI003D0D7018